MVLKRPLFAWILLSLPVFVAAHWLLKDIWFRFEDLHVLYFSQQFSEMVERFSGNPELRPYFSQVLLYPWQYHLFGYNPLGYLALSVAMFLLAIVTLAFFVRRITGSLMVAGLVMLLFGSGFIGVESLSWGPINGFQTYLVITLFFAALLLLLRYNNKGSPLVLFGALVLWMLLMFLFQFRSYFFVLPALLFLLLYPQKQRGRTLIIFALLVIISLIGFVPLLLPGSEGKALPLKFGEILLAGLGNPIAASLPLSLVKFPSIGYSLIGAIGFITLLWQLFKKPRRLKPAIIFFTAASFAGSFALALAAPYVGSSPMVHENSHRFLSFIAIFSLPLVAIFLDHLWKRQGSWRYLAVLLLVALVITNIVGARRTVAARLYSENAMIKQFYTGLLAELPYPRLPVILFPLAVAPRMSIDPFTGGFGIGAPEYLGGLYHTNKENFTIVRSLPELLELANSKKLPAESVEVIEYSLSGVRPLGDHARLVLSKKQSQSPQGRESEGATEFVELNLPAYVPLVVEAEILVTSQKIDAEVPLYWQLNTHPDWREAWMSSQIVSTNQMQKVHYEIIPDEGSQIMALRFGPIKDEGTLKVSDINVSYGGILAGAAEP